MAEITTARPSTGRAIEDIEDVKPVQLKHETLGNVRLRHHETNEIILVPTPTRDPKDPLTW